VPTAHANGIDLEYETMGDPSDPALLMVMGLGGQLIAWSEGFVAQLTDRGFFTIRFDNRDVGLSTKFEGMPEITALFGGDHSSAPYRVEDMADDAAALLTELGVAQAHVMGVSMGGMITQALAVNHTDRVRSACSIMSTTGDRTIGAPSGEAIAALLRPIATSREEAIAASLEASKVIGSPAYPTPDDVLTERAAAAYDRCYCPEGTARQLGAILASPDRTEALSGLRMPFLVIHGEADPLVSLSGGEGTAAAVPGCTFITIPGMGHDLPEALWGQIISAVVANTALAAV
jgi:pimeloyl-ACP methyl ester carboxylesterase